MEGGKSTVGPEILILSQQKIKPLAKSKYKLSININNLNDSECKDSQNQQFSEFFDDFKKLFTTQGKIIGQEKIRLSDGAKMFYRSEAYNKF